MHGACKCYMCDDARITFMGVIDINARKGSGCLVHTKV